jgi:tRNA-splicing ligase RtcB
MPDAHFGYGPPVGSVILTEGGVMPFAVGVDIGCGMTAVLLSLTRWDLMGREQAILNSLRKYVPAGVGKDRARPTDYAEKFFAKHGPPPGLDNVYVMGAAMQKRHSDEGQVRDELFRKAKLQFGTLGAGNHFVELCEDDEGRMWIVLHSGSRGIGNVLATAHQKLAQKFCKDMDIEVEDKEFAYLLEGTTNFDAYIADLLWCQEYAAGNREQLMRSVRDAIEVNIEGYGPGSGQLFADEVITCHHNYAQDLGDGLWLTRKGAISANAGQPGIIPGSMGTATYIVEGKGNHESYCSAPHGAGRVMSRGAARRTITPDELKEQMAGKVWLDQDAEKLVDEAPSVYKKIEQVMEDAEDLVTVKHRLVQILSYKGL